MNRLLPVLLTLAVGCSSTAIPEKKEPAYPYPECAAIVKGIKNAVGEPDSLEIIEWNVEKGKATAQGKQDLYKVRIRAKDARGGLAVQDLSVAVSGSKVSVSSDTYPIALVGGNPIYSPVDPTAVRIKFD